LGINPKLQSLALDGKIEAYNLPQGVLTHLFRDIAAHNPERFREWAGTFADPRCGGGKINSITTEDLVEVIQFDGHDYLAYKTYPIQIAILRGTTADMDGNVTMEKEPVTLEVCRWLWQ